MRILLLVTLAFFASCGTPASPARNLAVDSVFDLDPEIKCTAEYTDAGPELVHTARCKLADKSWAICRRTISTNLHCGPLIDPPPTPPPPPSKDVAKPSATPTVPMQTPSPLAQ